MGDNITFVCFPVDEETERLRLREGIMTTLNSDPTFKSNSKLQGQPLSDEELERIKWLARFGNDSWGNNIGRKVNVKRPESSIRKVNETKGSKGTTTEDIRQYIENILQKAKLQGKDHIDLVSGDIHKQLGLKNSYPQVCNAMYKKMIPGDEVLHTTSSGYSSTIKIRYYIKNR